MAAEEIYWDELLKQVGHITTGAMVFLIIAAFFYRKYWNRALLAAFWYFLATFLLNLLEPIILWICHLDLDACVPILDYWGITNSHWLSIFYYTKDYILLGWFYILIFPNKQFGSFIKWTAVIFLIASVINYLFIEGHNVFGVFNPGINMIYVVGLPLIYLWYSQKESLRIPLQKNPYFWINIGLLIPNLLALFFYFTGDFNYETNLKLYVLLKIMRNGFEILGFVLVGIGFSRARFVRFIATNDGNEKEEGFSSSSP